MAYLGNFDSSTVEPQTAFEIMPPGIYKLRLVDATEKPNKAGTGTYINFQFEIMEPQQYSGRRVFDILNLNNPSQQAVQISQARLSALVRAVGLVTVQDTDQLLMRPFMANLKVQPASGGYAEKNVIGEYIHDSVKTAPSENVTPAAARTTPAWATPK